MIELDGFKVQIRARLKAGHLKILQGLEQNSLNFPTLVDAALKGPAIGLWEK